MGLHTIALVALAVDALLFRFTVGPLGIAGQYAVRAAAAGLIATFVLATKRARAEQLGLSFRDFAADAKWLAKVVAVLIGVSVVLMALAVAVLRILRPPLEGWPLESRGPGYVLFGLALAPVIEEFVYRGLMIPGLRPVHGPKGTIVVGAFVFYALHLLYGYPYWMVHYAVAGGILTWAFLRRGKLWICVVLHAGGNLLVLVDDATLTWFPEAFRAIVGGMP